MVHDESSSNPSSLTGQTFEYDMAVTAELVDAYAEATGDHNPVHVDDAAARLLGFPGRIAHGMLIGGAFSRHFASDFPGPGTIYVAQALRFRAPVLVGAQGKIRLHVLSHVGRRLIVQTQMLVDDKVCVEGEAELMLSKGYRVPSRTP